MVKKWEMWKCLLLKVFDEKFNCLHAGLVFYGSFQFNSCIHESLQKVNLGHLIHFQYWLFWIRITRDYLIKSSGPNFVFGGCLSKRFSFVVVKKCPKRFGQACSLKYSMPKSALIFYEKTAHKDGRISPLCIFDIIWYNMIHIALVDQVFQSFLATIIFM